MSTRHCIHYSEGNCLLASRIAGSTAPTYPDACVACKKSPRPMALNAAVCTLAYAINKDPAIKEAFNRLNPSFNNRPGTALRSIFQELGISEGSSCQCDEYASIMDLWGSDGCEERIDEITEHLNSQSVSWFDILKVGLGGYLTTKSLVEKAIRLSRQ